MSSLYFVLGLSISLFCLGLGFYLICALDRISIVPLPFLIVGAAGTLTFFILCAVYPVSTDIIIPNKLERFVGIHNTYLGTEDYSTLTADFQLREAPLKDIKLKITTTATGVKVFSFVVQEDNNK